MSTGGDTRTAPVGAQRDLLFWLVVAIALSTAAAGLVQMVAPGLLLDLLDAERTKTTKHFFAIVAMFMTVIGAATAHALLAPGRGDQRVLLLWSGVQKFGAFVFVGVGVLNDVFSGLAVLIAVNDLVSSGVILWYRQRLQPTP